MSINENSSYYKVYNALYKTQDCVDLVRRTFDDLKSCQVVSRHFEVPIELEDGKKIARIRPWWKASFGEARTLQEAKDGDGKHRCFRFRATEIRDSAPFTSVVRKDEAERIVTDHFGHDVGTWGCQRAVCLDGKNWKKFGGSYHTEPFHTWLNERVSSGFAKDEIYARLEAHVRSDQQSEEFKEAERAAFIESANATIGRALQAYRHLGDEVLRDAVRAYVVDDIMER